MGPAPAGPATCFSSITGAAPKPKVLIKLHASGQRAIVWAADVVPIKRDSNEMDSLHPGDIVRRAMLSSPGNEELAEARGSRDPPPALVVPVAARRP